MVQHHKKGRKYWLVPGGGLEFGETIEECVKRELQEETNLEISVGEFLFLSESLPPDKHRHVVNLYYRAHIESGTIKMGEDRVISDLKFIPISEVPSLPFFPNVKKELLTILQNPDLKFSKSLGNKWE